VEEKVRIVIAGLRNESSIAGLWRKEGINQNLIIAGRRTSSRFSPASSDEVKRRRADSPGQGVCWQS
jgi:hypothetical protein